MNDTRKHYVMNDRDDYDCSYTVGNYVACSSMSYTSARLSPPRGEYCNRRNETVFGNCDGCGAPL